MEIPVHNWRINNYPQKLKKVKFDPLLSSVLYTAANPTTIQSGFRTTGLLPFDSKAVNYGKLVINYNQFYKDLEQFLPKIAIEKYTNAKSSEDQHLFLFVEKCERKNIERKHAICFEYFGLRIWIKPINANLNDNQTKCLNMEYGDTTLGNSIDLSGALAHHDGATLSEIEVVGQVLEISLEDLITTRIDDFMDQVKTTI